MSINDEIESVAVWSVVFTNFITLSIEIGAPFACNSMLEGDPSTFCPVAMAVFLIFSLAYQLISKNFPLFNIK